jgi:hypothetical protein
MTSMDTRQQRIGFLDVLAAPGRSPEIPEELDAYGWLVGSWTLEVVHYAGVNVSARGIVGEAHFGWVLEGRAIQDAWIMPRWSERAGYDDKGNDMYGSTMRMWDASIKAWRISWKNPVSGHREEQIGRWRGRDVVQIGTRADGTISRWSFVEITPDSFHWLGEALDPDGVTWRMEGEFLARRISR